MSNPAPTRKNARRKKKKKEKKKEKKKKTPGTRPKEPTQPGTSISRSRCPHPTHSDEVSGPFSLGDPSLPNVFVFAQHVSHGQLAELVPYITQGAAKFFFPVI